MVILLGGYSCTGKTLLANRLMKELKVPYFSMDYLKMAIFRSDESCGFRPMDSDEHIADKIWPIVKEMIYTYIENGQDMIIEGCYVMPEAVSKLNPDYMNEIYPIFIGFSETYIRTHFQEKIIAYKGAIEEGEPIDERPMEHFIEQHASIKMRTEQNGFRFYEINDDYGKSMERVFNVLKEILGK